MTDNTNVATQCGLTNEVSTEHTPSYRPRVDILENSDSYLIVADVPGAGEDDVEIALEKNVLILTANVKSNQPEGYESLWRGYEVGNWSRRFRLGESVDQEGVDATIKNGVLRIILPKSKTSLKTSVRVRSGD